MDGYLLSTGRGAALILALFALPDRDRYVVLQRHFADRTREDVAAELGVSRQRVAQIEERALTRLAAHLAPIRRELAA